MEVRWEAIDVDPMVEVAMLKHDGVDRLWSTQVGGVTMDPEVEPPREAVAAPGSNTPGTRSPSRSDSLAANGLIATFDADRGSPFDSLNIDRYVDAFARVTASKSLKPPLSVGLFGDWGSGNVLHGSRLQTD